MEFKNTRSVLTRALPFVMFASLNAADKTSQTVFKSRSFAHDAVKEYALHNHRAHHTNPHDKTYGHPENNTLLNMEKTFYYQASTNSKELARYFLLGNKTSLRVNEDGGAVTGVDIDSDWLNLSNSAGTFNSTFHIRPERKSWGTVFKYQHDMSKLLNGLYVSAKLPIVHVMHDLRLTESLGVNSNFVDSLLNTIVDVKGALNQETWRYARFSNNKQEKTGADDLELKIGYNFLHSSRAHVGANLNILFPLTDKPTAQYIFEPTLGNCGHWGLGLGVDGDYRFFGDHKNSLSMFANLKWQYLFSETELRTFDLVGKPWSRYLQVVKSANATAFLPGNNYFTREMKVTPRSMVELMAALHYQHSSFGFEAGYNLWWKDKEKVTLRRAWDSTVETIGISNLVSGSASASTISTVGATDGTFTTVAASNIDLESATHKAALTHKIYGGFSVDYKTFHLPSMVGFGAAYEFSRDNTALDNWEVWLKCGMNF